MQVYRDIPILAAAPSASDCARVPHRLYGIYDASVRGNVVDWLEQCKAEIAAARAQNKTPIVVGGTGMYIEALTDGVTPIPETPTPSAAGLPLSKRKKASLPFMTSSRKTTRKPPLASARTTPRVSAVPPKSGSTPASPYPTGTPSRS